MQFELCVMEWAKSTALPAALLGQRMTAPNSRDRRQRVELSHSQIFV